MIAADAMRLACAAILVLAFAVTTAAAVLYARVSPRLVDVAPWALVAVVVGCIWIGLPK